MAIIVAADPGAKGAFCALDSVTGDIDFCDFSKATPLEMLQWLRLVSPDRIWIEDVHSLFGMSAKSNFNFGRNLGIIQTIADIHGKGYETVTPKIWQKAVGVTSKGKAIKKDVANLCKQKYPQANIYGPKGGLLDGRSDALMIAEYGLSQYKE